MEWHVPLSHDGDGSNTLVAAKKCADKTHQLYLRKCNSCVILRNELERFLKNMVLLVIIGYCVYFHWWKVRQRQRQRERERHHRLNFLQGEGLCVFVVLNVSSSYLWALSGVYPTQSSAGIGLRAEEERSVWCWLHTHAHAHTHTDTHTHLVK